ncbi:hypothetical protein L21TH_2634 [Caldisalinibacter kiritimatiensis]|uniref:Uncharacterized protein n=2 Tax=Caldisalinibacter kiritimatiensis TaxID=1304284 RepID=R1ART5_9FIRM|nr:hypothetical protein L21TH_2634 [Caldisalinibacter kiritimatiensis]
MYVTSIIGIITSVRIETEKGFLLYFLLFILAILSTILLKKQIIKEKDI